MVAIAASAFFIYMVRTESLFGDASSAALLSVIAVGICVGFLPWNFHPARIFMGDSGSMLLGHAAHDRDHLGRRRATRSRRAAATWPRSRAAILVPLLVLAIPFLDVDARRDPPHVASGKAIGQADKEHIHHRLLEIGHSHRSRPSC